MAYSYTTGSPVLQGMLQGNQFQAGRIQNKQQQEKLKTLPEMLQAQLMQQQQAAEQAGIQTQYMPDKLKSSIALNRAQLPLMAAQTQLTQLKTELMPGDQAIAAQRALTGAGSLDQSRNRFNQLYQANQFLKTPGGQQWAASNPQAAESILRANSANLAVADQQAMNQMTGQGRRKVALNNPRSLSSLMSIS